MVFGLIYIIFMAYRIVNAKYLLVDALYLGASASKIISMLSFVFPAQSAWQNMRKLIKMLFDAVFDHFQHFTGMSDTKQAAARPRRTL